MGLGLVGLPLNLTYLATTMGLKNETMSYLGALNKYVSSPKCYCKTAKLKTVLGNWNFQHFKHF